MDATELVLLFDYYGALLTQRQQECFELRYNQDLSLAEIADEVGISRQGVRHIIKKGEENLLFLENRLHLANRHREMKRAAEELLSLCSSLEDKEGAAPLAEKIRACASLILENNQN